MKVKIKKLVKEAVLPKYTQDGDCAMDLTAISYKGPGGMYQEYGTGLAIELPPNHVGLIFPRSSVTSKALSLGNSIGMIDENFRGEIKLRFYQEHPTGGIYSVGDRIGQLIILPYPKIELDLVEELSDTNRGTGGFGSTGA